MAVGKRGFFKRHLRKILTLMVIAALIGGYFKLASPTLVAMVNYEDFQVARVFKSNTNSMITINMVSLENIEQVANYDLVLFFGRGLNLEPEQFDFLQSQGIKGLKMFMEGATNPNIDVTNLRGQDLDFIGDYIKYGGSANYRSLLNYVRSVFDQKKLFVDELKKPIPLSQDLVFHLKEDEMFETVSEFEQYAALNGIHKPGQPKVAMVTSVPGPFNSNRDHVDGLINSLANRGLNVYPMAALNKRLEFLQAVNPDAVVFMPHGRITLNDTDAALKWLKDGNVPMFGPISVFQNHDEWIDDQQGMMGALITMSIVLPEFDGAITPYAIAAKYSDENGYQIFKAIPERMEKFTAMVRNWIDLKVLHNKDKKLAIYYYKGPGKNAMTAGGMEVAESLYNTLDELKGSGFNVDGLPENLASFKQLIQRQGPVLGPYAAGDMAEFFKHGKPARVSAEQFDLWCKEELKAAMCAAVEARYGRSPGNYMVDVKDGIEHIGVARIQLGNVVILPQPLPGIGDNTFALVHGTREAPPHPYVASYLWTRKVFQPDAIMHFGTHGSLEFTPWKQVALSDYDWSDALVGGLPHFYIYTINNVGEAIIAKRRSYATILSHLTAPFMESGVHNQMKSLADKLQSYHQLENGSVKASYARSITEMAKDMGIVEQLNIGGEKWSEADFFALSNHVETVSSEKITEGLYTLNKPYTAEQIDSTTRLIATDPLAYSMASLDVLKGKIDSQQLDNKPWFNANYQAPAKAWVNRVLTGEQASQVLPELISTKELVQTEQWFIDNRRLTDGEIIGGFVAMGSMEADLGNVGGNLAENLESVKSLLIKIIPHPERLEFLQSLKSEKQFVMVSKSLDPELLKQAQTIAKAIPAMAAGLKISQQGDVNQLLRLMQKPAIYEQVFVLLNDPQLADSVAKERAAVATENKQLALQSDNLKALSLALNDMQRPQTLPNMDKAELQNFIDVLQFYLAKKEGLELSSDDSDEGINKQVEILAALLAVNDFDDRIEVAKQQASEKIRIIDQRAKSMAHAVRTIEQNLISVNQYREDLANSPSIEMQSLLNALSGGYILPSSGGDLVRNPRTLPTGRNMFSVDAEQTPTVEAWDVGVKLADSLLENHLASNDGEYPKKITFTLWPGDFIQTEGAQLAQIFYLLGVEPVRDPFNRVVSIKPIPLAELGRPRIDIVAQTAGQFRDLAASRILLINKAIEMVSQLDETASDNFVRSGVSKSERMMVAKGISPVEARELASTRVFGGANGAYGTGIMGMVERGDSWEKDSEVAQQYLNNMGAVYGKGDKWSYYREGVFEAALQDAEVVVQPRESNTWGALSLDHVYEFMGGLNLAVREVTGEDPKAYFNDFRQANNPEVQTMEDAVWTEAQATLFNPQYIKAIQQGSASSAEKMAETFRNTYGWNVMKPDAIKDELWDEVYETYVDDKYDLGVQDFFENENPYALQEMTAVMMETARKGLWEASDEQLNALATLHAELIEKYDAGCTIFVCDNSKLRDFISQRLPEQQRQNYQQQIKKSLEAPSDANEDSMVLEKEVVKKTDESELPLIQRLNWGLILGLLLILATIAFLASRRRQVSHLDTNEL
ncbi:cobaltochelatase subunit CobN [Thalassotalea psychrophila]|uniref:Cobaltochelatase subunit CobN n=1 Tax=Thalassotalea psychrophila TaxID=3065647 RepID=A0ABY9TTK4_9GAMM|nr:cobaltochelatase subunit CobN [Colwelliaceae bacterium SQ149]